MSLRTISYGGGVQSTALLVLAARRTIDFPVALFANTGEDSENPDSLAYVHDVAVPYARAHDLTLIELQHRLRDGSPDSILGRIERTARSEVIPVRSSEGGPPMSRSCTVDFKIRVLGKWLTENGASESTPATVAVGFSLDEIHRANRQPQPYERIAYPLIRIGDESLPRPLTRLDCQNLIRDEGLPVPPKSSCWFCPFHSFNAWVDLRRDRPDLFARSADLERLLTAKAGAPRYLTRYGAPLEKVVPDGIDMLPFDEETGDCMDGACGL